MKDSDSVVRSPKKANAKGPADVSGSNTKITKFFSSFYSSNNSDATTADTSSSNKNGTTKMRASTETNGKPGRKRGRKKRSVENDTATQKSSKSIANGTKRKKSNSSSQVSTASSSSSASSTTMPNEKSIDSASSTVKKSRKRLKNGVKGNSKTSPKLRPRRRASQTYFFKYQLARNPLKAEEEDLKLALLASLQQDDSELSKQHLQQLRRQQLIYEHHLQNNKQPRKGVNGNNSFSNSSNNNANANNSTQQSNKQQKQKHPPPPENTTVVQHYKPMLPAYDEEYLKKYRPDTEDFLTFICSRLQKASDYLASKAPEHLADELSTTVPTASGSIDQLSHSTYIGPSNGCAPTTTGINVRISNDKTSNEFHNLRRSASPCKSSTSNHTVSNSSPNLLNSPSNRRRPTRQSPRLANTSRKISEFDSLNQYTAYDSQIMYEEEMNRASMALEDIAQEINRSDDSETGQQYSARKITGNQTTGAAASETNSLSPYKNNKHLIRGLMTREFAGAFADEEIIFENIKNHKL